MNYEGDPILSTDLRISFQVELTNGKLKRTSTNAEAYYDSETWKWWKVEVQSPQATFRYGKLSFKRNLVRRNNDVIDLYTKFIHHGQIFYDTFNIKLPALVYYKIMADSLQPYHWNKLYLLAQFDNGRQAIFKDETANSFFDWDAFGLQDTRQLEFKNGKVYLNYSDSLLGNEVYFKSVYLPAYLRQTDTLYVAKLQKFYINYSGLDGEDGPNGRNGEDGGAGEDGGDGEGGWNGGSGMDGAEIEVVVHETANGIELIIYVDSLVEWYVLGSNPQVLIDLKGGDGGNGGKGGNGGDGGSATETNAEGSDGNGGRGGNGGDGGYGGTVTIISSMDLKKLDYMFSLELQGGNAGNAGRGGYGDYNGKSGSNGKNGLDGYVNFMILSPTALKELVDGYKH